VSESRARALKPEQRRRLLDDLSRLSIEADRDKADIQHVFLPLPRHSRALHPQTMVIRGERGAGKTALFHFLQAMREAPQELVRVFHGAQLPEATWVEGFSEAREHPRVELVDAFAASATKEQLRVFWIVHLACRLASDRIVEGVPHESVWEIWRRQDKPEAWVSLGQQRLADLSRWLDDAHRLMAERDRTVFLTYDHLDKIGLFTKGVRESMTGSLLALWLSLSNRYSHLRAKIFVREDLFEASRDAFPDASKLKSRSVSLDWDVESLYRALIRHMAWLSDDVREWIESGQRQVPLEQDPVLHWVPPQSLPEVGFPSQKAFVDHLAGEQMGRGVKKGYTYRWIPNRLQDAHKRIVPRSLLNLVGNSAEAAARNPKARHHQLLTPADLHEALEQTSKSRVDELKEEHKVVARLASLSGLSVMLEAGAVQRRLADLPEGAEHDGFETDGSAAMRELLRLGVLQRRSDGRIDVPDIYRYGFHIKRKGGVASPH
jgi:hypothetical protein